MHYIDNQLSPIILFVYNRPEHTLRCLESLMQNVLSDKSILYIYVDKILDDSDLFSKNKWNRVNDVIKSKQWCKVVNIVYREKNYGIEKNTIEAVTEISMKYGRVIVLEDDLVLSDSFLEYMNTGLEKYKNTESVKQICGCNLFQPEDTSDDVFFLPITSSWGWGTWSRVWNLIDFSNKLRRLTFTESFLFDIEGTSSYSKMLTFQYKSQGRNTWDILFWFYVFKSKGLALFPKFNLVTNTGFDGSGIHYTRELKIKEFNRFHSLSFHFFPIEETFSQLNIEELKKTLLILNQDWLGRFKNKVRYYISSVFHIGISLKRYYQ